MREYKWTMEMKVTADSQEGAKLVIEEELNLIIVDIRKRYRSLVDCGEIKEVQDVG